jgi:hypothetical protein
MECDFVPAMALHNKIDVGNVELGPLTIDQSRIIRGFTERTRLALHRALNRLKVARRE